MELRGTGATVGPYAMLKARLRAMAASSFFPLLTAALAVLIVYAVFMTGIRRGMDHVMPYGPESELNAITIALSDMVYDLNAGYVGYASVKGKLVEFMSRGGDNLNDPRIIPNLSDGDLINSAIQAARSLGPQPESFIGNRTLMTMLYDDVGIVDFDKIGFYLFGYKIQSLYYTFFAILALSTAAFQLQFWTRPVAQIILLCNLFAFVLELNTPIFIKYMPSFWGMRHGSTLALLPMWHFALLLLYRVRLSAVVVIPAVVQLAILILAITTRGSAAWTVFFLVGLPVFVGFLGWRRTPREERSLKSFVRTAAAWPAILVLVGLFANSIYMNAKLHPAYFTDDITPYHGAWHSAFLGLSYSPKLWSAAGMGVEDRTDGPGYRAAIAYLRSHHFIEKESDVVSPWTGTYKFRLHDNVMRRVVLSLIMRYPATTFGLYTYLKPTAIYSVCRLIFDTMKTKIWLLTIAGAAFLGALTVLTGLTTPARVWHPFLLVAAAIPFAALPNLWAYSAVHTVADLILSMLMLSAFALWAIFVAFFSRLRRSFGRGERPASG